MGRWQFDWDEGNRPKCERRAPIADIEAVFDNRKAIKGQTGTAERWWVVDPDKRICLIFTYRKVDGRLRIRVISARFMHAEELPKWHRRRHRIR
jgi:uncharacterized DUF497 family protein